MKGSRIVRLLSRVHLTLLLLTVTILSSVAMPVAAGSLNFQLEPTQPVAGQPFSVVVSVACNEFQPEFLVEYDGSIVRVVLKASVVTTCPPGGPALLPVPIAPLAGGPYTLEFYGSYASTSDLTPRFFIQQAMISVAASSPNGPRPTTVPATSENGLVLLVLLIVSAGVLAAGMSRGSAA